MKKKVVFLLFLSVVFSLFAEDTINEGWSFYYPDWQREKWETVNLPHSYNIEECMEGKSYYRGEVFYQRQLRGDELDKQQRTFIRFGAACLVAEVSINDVFLGEHRGGYSAFIFELTDYLKYDGSDTLLVRVDNSKRGDVMPLSGDFNLYGGLTREVQLLTLPQTSISPLHYASGGVYIHPVEVSSKKVIADVEVHCSNRNNEATEGFLSLSLLDEEGVEVVSALSEVPFALGESVFSRVRLEIENPNLWDGMENPYLYQLKVQLMDSSSNILDERVETTGFRSFYVDADKGFFLNENYLKLKGVNRHHDFEGVGAALTQEHHDLDMKIIKEMGTNALRLAHYQQAPYFYDLADQEGMVVWAEIPFVSFGLEKAIGINRKAFLENGYNQLSELIYQNFNHPSILFWGIYNEIKNFDAPTGIVKELNAYAKKIDPSRLTVGAANFSGPFNKVTDLLGWNKYTGWYAGLPKWFSSWTDRYFRRNPEQGFSISEYGAGASIYQHQAKLRKSLPGASWHPENWQCTFHEVYWETIKERDFIWGSYVWNMFDFSAVNRNEGDHKGRNDKGLVTYDRKLKKDVFYFYQAQWNSPEVSPVLYITDRRFTERKASLVNIKVYSNLDEVELWVNDELFSSSVPNDLSIAIWADVPLDKGENKVLVRGMNDGGFVKEDSVFWMYE